MTSSWQLALTLLTAACLGGGGCATSRSSSADWSSAQAAAPRGAGVYERECASCHGTQGEGSRGVPEVAGDGALPLRRGKRPAFRTARDLYDYVSTTMPLPPKKVATLRSEQYWDVVQLLLRARGLEPPSEGLSSSNASDLLIN